MAKVKKIESDSIAFNEIAIREPLVEDLIMAERIAGSDTGINFALAVISRIAEFDGKTMTVEELRRLKAKDFLLLAKDIADAGLEDAAKELLSSQKKVASN
ncbi:MAG: phage tail assembly protein [Endomicrobia bacterium]|nr:phage tail assembly protein [Endomicrobiia bacterium]